MSKEEIEFCTSLEKMFNYLKNKKKLTEFEKLVIINFDYITKEVLSPECKTATEIVSKNMYYELIKRKEEYYEKQIDQLELDKQKLIEKLEKRIKSVDKCYDESLTDEGGVKIIIEEVINKRNCLLVQKYCYEEILKFVKGE